MVPWVNSSQVSFFMWSYFAPRLWLRTNRVDSLDSPSLLDWRLLLCEENEEVSIQRGIFEVCVGWRWDWFICMWLFEGTFICVMMCEIFGRFILEYFSSLWEVVLGVSFVGARGCEIICQILYTIHLIIWAIRTFSVKKCAFLLQEISTWSRLWCDHFIFLGEPKWTRCTTGNWDMRQLLHYEYHKVLKIFRRAGK